MDESIGSRPIDQDRRARMMTEACARGYRAAARGEYEIHKWTLDGQVVKEVPIFPDSGVEFDPEVETEELKKSLGSFGEIAYGGALSAEEALELADRLDPLSAGQDL